MYAFYDEMRETTVGRICTNHYEYVQDITHNMSSAYVQVVGAVVVVTNFVSVMRQVVVFYGYSGFLYQ